MKKKTHKIQRTGGKHPVLSAVCFTILYFILAAVLFFGIAFTKHLSEYEAFSVICIAVILYIILMAVCFIKGSLTRKRMARRLSSPERRAGLQQTAVSDYEDRIATESRSVLDNRDAYKDHIATENRSVLESRSIQEEQNAVSKRPSVSSGRRKSKKVFAVPLICLLLLVCGLVAWFGWNSKRIPDSLKELKAKYPETASFVDNYPQNKNKKWTIDLSGEMQAESIPLFLQWDERWGYETYGSSFLAVTGCGPTCISMVVCGLTGDTYWNPYETAKFSEQQGYYVPGEGTSWNLMTEGAQILGLNASYGEVSADYIYSNLDSSHPMICSMYPGDFTYTGHFIVLTGIDSEGCITVNDPNSRINSNTHWTMDTLLPQIRSLWSYSAA